MSIFGALLSGVSGLAAQSQSLGIISDNISNVNTVGYKGTSAQFSTLVTRAVSQTLYSPGGVRSVPTPNVDRQGLLQSTQVNTDLGIVGNGLFVVNEAATPALGNEYAFTRAGSFRADKDGALRNAAGFYLQGWPLTNGALPANTTVLSSLQTVNVSSLAGSATPTTTLDLGANLPSTAINGETHSITAQIFDSLGNAHDVQIDFVYDSATPKWDITVNNPTLSSTGAASGTVTAATRSISFNGNGTPAAITFPPIAVTYTGTTANPSTITTNLGTVGQTNGITQFAGQFAVSFINQNGVQFGTSTSVEISDTGVVTALFDNGQRKDIYKLPLAVFSNPNGLESQNGNAYIATDRSGNTLLLEGKTGAAGSFAPAQLESSTVDLAEEFTNMIVTQRAYSGNARVISTANEMLEELIRVI